MSTLSIHGLAPQIEHALRERARCRNQSLNQTIKEVLENNLAPGYSSRKQAQNREMFAEFFGTWSDEDAEAFDKATADFGKVNPEDWQ
jgi:hypothetical protein